MLHEGYVLEALLAYTVCNGNIPILRYIHRKANISITNRLIATIMRLLPKEEGVCHHHVVIQLLSVNTLCTTETISYKYQLFNLQHYF